MLFVFLTISKDTWQSFSRDVTKHPTEAKRGKVMTISIVVQ